MRRRWQAGLAVIGVACAAAVAFAAEIRVAMHTALERPSPAIGSARVRLLPEFFAAQTDYPPADVTLVVFRDTRSLELYARAEASEWRRVLGYVLNERPTLAEGVHALRALEAAGSRLDLRIGVRDGASLGLAGSAAADLAALAAETGANRFRLIVADTDPRLTPVIEESDALRSALRAELASLPPPEPPQPRSIRRKRVSVS